MIYMKHTLLTALLLALLFPPALAQTQSLEEQWRASSAELARYYSQKNWPEALRVIEQQLKLAERTGNREALASVLYNKSCVHALAGQKEPALAAIRQAADDQHLFKRSMKSQLVLVPKGAPNPKKFAGGNEDVFAGAIYTSNPDTFYVPPKRSN